MRLTLRTLLAYMDEILEPGDREELAKKVESSEFANELIHRTKDTMRRLRLSAPQVLGTGMALDPNTVAEYLDNALPPESVADFERICLESDVHLAEVASAHHVLTMVLGEPAEVDPLARQRMYGLPADVERRKHAQSAPVYASPAAPANYAEVTPAPHVFSPTAAPLNQLAPAHQDVPDYLRANAWTRHGTLLAACAGVLLLAVGWLVYTAFPQWFGGGTQLAQAPKSADVTANLQPPAAPPVDPNAAVLEESADDSMTAEIVDGAPAANASARTATGPTENSSTSSTSATSSPALMGGPPKLNMPAMATAAAPRETVAGTTDATLDSSASPEPPPQTVGMDESAYGYGEKAIPRDERYADAAQDPAEPVASLEQPAASQQTPVQPANEALTANIAPAPTENLAPQPTDLAAATAVVPPQDELAPPTNADVAEPREMTGGVSAAADATAAEIVDADTEAAPPEPVELGTYLDGKNVLLRRDPQTGAWFRLAPRSTLYSGDKLLALPAFYPKLAFASGLHVKMAGGSMITLLASASDSNEPAIDVGYGKVVLVNTSNADTGMKLAIGGEVADVQLARNATLAIDVAPQYLPGNDPRKAPAPIVAELFARDGNIIWTDEEGKRDIPAPSHWTIAQGLASPPSAGATFPDWIDQEPFEQRSEKMYGAPSVETALDSARPVEEQLLELYESSRRREVKSLVARSSVYAGLFVPFVEALRDSDQKASWKMHIDTLRSAMALGPDSAERIYRTLVDQRGQRAADDLYQMLCGYNPQQFASTDEFRTGLGTQLVDWMEEDSLDYRVLAVQDMNELTGMKLMSNPAGSPTERARGVRLWRQRLKDGEINLPKPAAP